MIGKENKCLDCLKLFVSAGHCSYCYDCSITRANKRKIKFKQMKGGNN